MTIPATIATGGHVTDAEIVDAQLAILQLLAAFSSGVLKAANGGTGTGTSPLPIANGGTGSATQNFVDLTTTQNVGGQKVFTEANTYFGIGSGTHTYVRIRGGAASKQACILGQDSSGNDKWVFGRESDDSFIIYDFAGGRNVMTCAGSGAPVLYQEAWTALSGLYVNSWVDFGAPQMTGGYMKDACGFVHLRGLIKSGLAATIATLPAGYRPSATVNYADESNGAFGNLSITSAGVIALGTFNLLSVSLDGITFDTR